ncbi:branched-chain amino acid ABC transporter substrate-binding protein [Desulfitobacterium sp. Sab5]|uniref:branched-chain amino acid ABC transporter substrate-binding protein n=1 Tax=Desulfitobacterium nosdiversum TaxID=3375356 RepID=UPI003CEEC711
MKKGIAVILSFTMILSILLTGCGTGGTQKKTAKIAFIAPITGSNAAVGLGMRNSAELAVKQANAKGDLPFNLELVVMDDAGDPATGVNAVNKVASDPSVVAAVAHFNSGVALATKDVFHKYGLPAVIAAAINDKITADGYPEITRVITSSKVQNIYAGDVATKQFGVKKIAVIHDQTDYGKTNAEQFLEEAKQNGATILSFDGISVGQQDFSALLTKIKQESPDMIFFGGLATEAGLIKRQMSGLNISAIFMSDSGIHSKTFTEIAGTAGEGTIAHGLVSPIEKLPKGKEFIDAYNAANYKEYYEAYGPFAYDGVNIIIQALKTTKSTDRATVAKAIKGTKDFEGILGKTSFGSDGQTTLNTVLTYVVQDGKWIPLADSKYKIANGKIQ